MVVIRGLIDTIKAKAKSYDTTKEKIKDRIKVNINIVIEKLTAVEKDLLDEVERELGRNPYAEFLYNTNTNPDKYTDADAERFLAEEKIPENFGPDENSLSTLLKNIDSYRAWRNKMSTHDLVPQGLRWNKVTYDAIALSWAAVNSDCTYEIELRSSTSLKIVHYSDKPAHTFSNLKPGTEHYIRVRAVLPHRDLKCTWSDPITVKTKNLYARDVATTAVSWNEMDVTWETDNTGDEEVKYTVEVRKVGEKAWKEVKSGLTEKKCRVGGLEGGKEYEARVRCAVIRGNSVGEWSKAAKFTTPEFRKCCVWKTCPGDVDDNRKYSVDEGNPRIATKINNGDDLCTIIGNTHIPLSKVTRWNIIIHKSGDNDGGGIFIGIAPNDINQNVINYDNYGWYYDCFVSTLRSGPPHNYRNKEYGPRKGRDGQYVHTGDSVGVVVDTTRGDLSFVLNGVNRGAAYCGIPLDKPLVPSVILFYRGDSVEFII